MRALPLSPLERRVLGTLTDWKSARHVSRELGIDEREAQRALEGLLEKGLVYHDGPLFIRREGRA